MRAEPGLPDSLKARLECWHRIRFDWRWEKLELQLVEVIGVLELLMPCLGALEGTVFSDEQAKGDDTKKLLKEVRAALKVDGLLLEFLGARVVAAA
eukprot:4467992-Lingulodinium_polyedra.AAC.1